MVRDRLRIPGKCELLYSVDQDVPVASLHDDALTIPVELGLLMGQSKNDDWYCLRRAWFKTVLLAGLA